MLRGGQPLPAPPWLGRHVSDEIQVIVGADGTVDSALTRHWSSSSDKEFQRAALATIRRWTFDPGVQDGRPTRSGFRLVLHAPTRDDTTPARLVWAWRRGGEVDTLAGTWERAPSPSPLTPGQRDTVVAAMLRQLVRMQVITTPRAPALLSARERALCVLSASGSAGDSAARVLVRTVLADGPSERGRIAPAGCERSPHARRLVIPRVHATEEGRAVMYAAGDYLARWPHGLAGTTWRAWTGRCVARIAAHVVSTIACDVSPEMESEESRNWNDASYGISWFYADRTRHGQPRHPDSLDVRLRVTTTGAWREDTLIARVGRPRSLRDRAAHDSVSPCGTWTAHSPQDSAVLVIHGDISGYRSLDVTAARATPAPRQVVPEGCGAQALRIAQFAAFLLGGVGEPATAPVSLCFYGRGGCYLLDPRRHLAAAAPQLRFRMADLHADTRRDGSLDFELRVDEAPDDLLPIAVIRRGTRRSVWIARRRALDRWDFGVTGYVDLDAETEVLIYLVRR